MPRDTQRRLPHPETHAIQPGPPGCWSGLSLGCLEIFAAVGVQLFRLQ